MDTALWCPLDNCFLISTLLKFHVCFFGSLMAATAARLQLSLLIWPKAWPLFNPFEWIMSTGHCPVWIIRVDLVGLILWEGRLLNQRLAFSSQWSQSHSFHMRLFLVLLTGSIGQCRRFGRQIRSKSLRLNVGHKRLLCKPFARRLEATVNYK